MGQVLTPIYKWPYPDSADPVKDGATRMGNLAKAIDATLQARIAGLLIQGAQSVVTTNAGGAAVVVFPFAFSSNSPSVVITGCTTAQDATQPQAFIATANTNSTQFTCWIKNQIGNAWIQSAAVRICWVAVGPA
jgi:hypothetical protein